MKTLLLLRHAKSSWKNPTLEDHDRPLKKRGRRAAPRMGRLAREQGLTPEIILCSTAVRAVETERLFSEEAEFRGELRLEADLYLAEPEAILALLAKAGLRGAEKVMVVGHNPGLEELLARLTGVEERFPTGALAEVRLPIESWERIEEAKGELGKLWRPRELD